MIHGRVFQLTSCGVYQRGAEHEGVFGFLVDDIKQESRRSARLVRYFIPVMGHTVGCHSASVNTGMVNYVCCRRVVTVRRREPVWVVTSEAAGRRCTSPAAGSRGSSLSSPDSSRERWPLFSSHSLPNLIFIIFNVYHSHADKMPILMLDL